MRITQQMLYQTALNDLQASLQQLAKLQTQAATGKRINRPGDDPFATEKALSFRARIQAGESALHSINMSLDWLTATEKALGDLGDILTRTEALALRGASESLGADGREALATEVDGILEQVVGIANTRHNDQYLFSGFQTDAAPFDITRDPTTGQITTATYVGDAGRIERKVEPGSTMAINVVGDSLFGDAFAALIDLRDGLQAGTFNVDDVAAAMTDVQTARDAAFDVRAAVGTKIRRLDTTAERLASRQTDLRALLSQFEDADLTEVISRLTQQQFLYQSALAVSGQVLKTSLIDFLQ